MLNCHPCRYEDFLSQWYRECAPRIGIEAFGPDEEKHGSIFHRKSWEFCAIYQALSERGMLASGRSGCGFAVGREPLPSAFAVAGVNILATDQPLGDDAKRWAGTDQYAGSLEAVYAPDLIERSAFNERVHFKPVDMRDLQLPWQESFDFVWSSCALEHLGSLEAGWRFVLDSLSLVRPGGVAIHTTEYNVASNDCTIETGGSVVYRQRDIEALDRRLRAMSCGLAQLDFFCGDDPHDLDFDYPPYYQNQRPHIKLLLDGHIVTSFLIVIQKSRTVGVHTAYDAAPAESADENKARVGNLEKELDLMRHSKSWRWTAPLRKIRSWMG